MIKKYLTLFVSALLFTVVVIHIALFIGGYRYYAVETGSMEPDIPQGSFIYVKSYKNKTDFYNNIGYDMDITFKTSDGKILTHRVIYIDEINDTLQTQSIIDGSIPDVKISRSQVIGKVEKVVPVVGYLILAVKTWYFWVILGCGIGIFFVSKHLIKEYKKEQSQTKKKNNKKQNKNKK